MVVRFSRVSREAGNPGMPVKEAWAALRPAWSSARPCLGRIRGTGHRRRHARAARSLGMLRCRGRDGGRGRRSRRRPWIHFRRRGSGRAAGGLKFAVSHVLDPAVKNNSAVALGMPERYGRPHAGLSRGDPRPGSVTLKNPHVVELSSWIVHTSPALRWMARTTP